jgi:hypothetical protein
MEDDPGLAVCVSVTVVAAGYTAEQTPGHWMPPALLLTEPLPFPDIDTVKV